MRISIAKGFSLFSMSLFFLGCTTLTVYGPTDYVAFKSTGSVKKSEVTGSIYGSSNKLFNAYDDEFVYDKDGLVIKEKQTEYLDLFTTNKNFIVWETEYKTLGGSRVPSSVSCNGVPFITVEYELTTAKSTGFVTQDMSERYFTQIINVLFKEPQRVKWNLQPSSFPVSFGNDGKFVDTVRRYSYNSGSYTDNVLTLGFDNVVLSHYNYSYEKLAEGLAKTNNSNGTSMMQNLSKGSNVDFKFQWEVIGTKISQKNMVFEGVIYGNKAKFQVDLNYNAAGQRTEEKWTTWDYTKNDNKPIVVYNQVLTY